MPDAPPPVSLRLARALAGQGAEPEPDGPSFSWTGEGSRAVLAAHGVVAAIGRGFALWPARSMPSPTGSRADRCWSPVP